MARIQNPIIGRAKGQAGGMVFTTLNGQNVMKAKPNSYRDANSPTQQDNRSLHTKIVRMVSSIKSQARSLFEKQPSDMPAFSKLVQQFSRSVNRSGSNPVFNPAGINIGSGSIELPDLTFTYIPNSSGLDVSYSVPAGLEPADLSVKLDLIVINKDTFEMVIEQTSQLTIGSGGGEMIVPDNIKGLHLCFALKNRTKLAGGADLTKAVK